MQNTSGEQDRPTGAVYPRPAIGGTRSCPTEWAGPLRTDTLADSVIILLALTAVQRLVGFGRAVLFCRWLDPQQLGQWDMAFSFIFLAAPLAVLSLPGTFGRYVERYRRQQQLRSFVKQTALVCTALAAVAVVVVYLGQGWFSSLIFGTSNHADLVTLLAICLAAVIVRNFLIELAMAMRNIRVVSIMQMANSLAFAVLGIGLLLLWRCTAASVVIAHAAAALISAVAAFYWLWRTWGAFPEQAGPQPPGTLWSKLIPFTTWIVMINLLTNLFEIVDRYMIVHYSPGSPAEALARVGEYHSSRVMPLLLVSIAAMLGTVIMPHLSRDWEAGRRGRVSARFNLFLKLLTFAMMAAAVAVLFAAPLLFDVAFRGKFAGGEAVLPWTLTYCIWFAMSMVAQKCLWCAEKASLAGVALLIGLVLNVCLNLVLMPRLGLLGAVLATAAANLVALLLILWFTHLLGFHVDRGIWVMLAVSPTICLGPWIASMALIAIALDAVLSQRILSREEKHQLAKAWQEYLERFRSLRLGLKWARGNST